MFLSLSCLRKVIARKVFVCYNYSIKGVYMKLGDKIMTKKQHPCGSNEWEVVRIGADYKLKCIGCGHTILVDSEKLKKIIRK